MELLRTTQHLYTMIPRRICKPCFEKWAHLGICPICEKLWLYCWSCCENIAKDIESFHLWEQDIRVSCESRWTKLRYDHVQKWNLRAVPITSFLITHRTKYLHLPNVIVTCVTQFLNCKDTYALTEAVLLPIWNGLYVKGWSPFDETYLPTMVDYFTKKWKTFPEQMKQLCKLHKSYIFELFNSQRLKLFRNVFPKLVSLPKTHQQQVKELLPLEFAHELIQYYHKKYVSRKLDASLDLFYSFFFLSCKLQLHHDVQEAKKSQNQNISTIVELSKNRNETKLNALKMQF